MITNAGMALSFLIQGTLCHKAQLEFTRREASSPLSDQSIRAAKVKEIARSEPYAWFFMLKTSPECGISKVINVRELWVFAQSANSRSTIPPHRHLTRTVTISYLELCKP